MEIDIERFPFIAVICDSINAASEKRGDGGKCDEHIYSDSSYRSAKRRLEVK